MSDTLNWHDLAGKEVVPEGIVTLSLPYGLGGVPVAQALLEFHAHYPDISIDLKTGPMQNNLGRREAELNPGATLFVAAATSCWLPSCVRWASP